MGSTPTNILFKTISSLYSSNSSDTLLSKVGGIYAKYENHSFNGNPVSLTRRKVWESNAKMGIIGFITTFIYDMFTNVVTGLVFELPLVAYIVLGVPFTAVHEISNFFFFFFAGNMLIQAIRKIVVKEVRPSDTEK